MSKKDEFSFRKMVVPVVVMVAFLVLGTVMWLSSGYIQALFFFGYIGVSIGVGLGLYAGLPKKRKPWGRKLTLFLVGGFLLIFMGVLQSENMQIEWVFFSILAGLMGAALTHYLIAKILGPLLFGRLWCGWACWTVMILDLLPFTRPSGRLRGRWGWLRYLHFVLSLTLVLVLWFGFNYRAPITFNSSAGLYWLLVGNALYYGIGIALAFALKDNRAFCKYVCPITVFLKATSRFSLLKIGGDSDRCDECGACVKTCPMDIRIPDYIKNGQRVLSTECTLCQTCVSVCTRDALKLSFGFDRGGKELLRERA
ncbi:MAG: 4Fe-4S binding protein [Anaerolineae bacterium]|nr:4Fe-4S binding protein [Anaerolineae bacterium]